MNTEFNFIIIMLHLQSCVLYYYTHDKTLTGTLKFAWAGKLQGTVMMQIHGQPGSDRHSEAYSDLKEVRSLHVLHISTNPSLS